MRELTKPIAEAKQDVVDSIAKMEDEEFTEFVYFLAEFINSFEED